MGTDCLFFAVVTLAFKILSGLDLETTRCKKLKLSMDIDWACRCATLWCDLDLTFDLVVVTLSLKILSGLYLETVRCRKLKLGRNIG